jgi:hypothetical protein
MQAIASGDSEQFFVGDTAPQEERQARRKFHVAEHIGRAIGKTSRLMLDLVQETRIQQQARERILDTRFKISRSPALCIERHQGCELWSIGSHGITPGARGKLCQQ